MQPPDDLAPPSPPKTGCAFKWIALLGVLFGGLALVCCGACGFFGYLFSPQTMQRAADIDGLAREIVNVTVPESFQPELGLKIDNFMVAFRVATYRQRDGRGVLEFTEIAAKIGDRAGTEAQIRQQMKTQPNRAEVKVLNIDKTEQREFTINGKPVMVRFQEGSDVSTGTHYRQVTADFEGKNGPASFTLQLEDAAWNEEEVLQLLNSMQ